MLCLSDVILNLLDLLRENLETLVHRLLESHGDFADGFDGLSDEIGVPFGHVLLELVEDEFVILPVDNPDQDLAE